MRRLLALAITMLSLLAGAATASATDFKGDVAYWSSFTVTVDDATSQVTALRGRSARLACQTPGLDRDPVGFQLTQPVPIVDGKFHAEGVSTESTYNDPWNWSLDATISLTRTITGTVTVSGIDRFTGETCSGTFRVAAIIPPAEETYHPHTYDWSSTGTTPSGYVVFNYSGGVIRNLKAQFSNLCPNTSSLGAGFESTSYHLDPIQVNNGRFRIETDVLDSYSVVTHVIITGLISGNIASGTIQSSRGGSISGELCSYGPVKWKAVRSAPTPPPVVAGGAFYDTVALRLTSGGSYSYYIGVRPYSCTRRVTHVRFTIAGLTKKVPCGRAVVMGPFTPKRTYRVNALAIKTRAKKTIGTVRLAWTSVYLPGSDGNWVPL